uniref:Uncharacterized protein n=1 Tax=Cucumis melo TaxID=3656 RepID=A0A9I9EJ44_CUCME
MVLASWGAEDPLEAGESRSKDSHKKPNNVENGEESIPAKRGE